MTMPVTLPAEAAGQPKAREHGEAKAHSEARGQSEARRRLLEPVAPDWLIALRVAYGLILSVSAGRFLYYGWVDRFFVEPRFHFKYWGLGWLGELPGPLLHALFGALVLLGLLVALGMWFRWSAWLLLAGFVYVQTLDVATYLNHYYLAALLGLLLACSPAGQVGTWSQLWRRWRGARSSEATSLAGEPTALVARSVPAFWLLLLRFQVAVVYVFAGLAKLHGDWLLDAQPLGIWLSSRADFPLLGSLFQQAWAPLAFSWAGFLFDSSIVLWLSWGRTRLPAYAVLLGFHALTSVLFPIGLFPVIMSAAALVFFPPEWPRRLWRRVTGEGESAAGRPAEAHPGGPQLPRFALALALAYCALQLLLPLRFLAYGGNVRWHEQGMRFSWRVMVREKNGSVSYRVLDRQGKQYEVSPARYLTPLQVREMSAQPDLIAQLARHVRDDFAARGLGPVQVYADAWASLNGRRRQRLIAPDVDLAQVSTGLAPASWILPAPPEPAPALRRRSELELRADL